MVLISVIGWTPQVFDLFNPGSLMLTPSTAYIICTVGVFYYPAAMTAFFKWIAPWMRNKYGKARTLRFAEIYLTFAWQMQTVGFTSLTMTTTPFLDCFKEIPTIASTVIGLILVALGIGSKIGAIFVTGYNTYYCFDMVLDTPNAYFVETGIYKFCGSPMYTVGRLTGFGAAIHYRSIPLLVASIADLITINLFNCFVEQPFVKRMYGGIKY